MWRRLLMLPSSSVVIFFTGLLSLGATGPAFAQQPKPARISDPAKADPDFAFIGEYVGELTSAEGKATTYGFQVSADPYGKFAALGYEGGLPGAGADSTKTVRGTGQASEGQMTFANLSGGKMSLAAVVRDGVMTITSRTKDGPVKLGELKRHVRQSPTLGAKPPPGAIILFDGSSTTAFLERDYGTKPLAKMTEDKHLMPSAVSKHWLAKDSSLHLEFRMPHLSSGISCVWLQKTPETMIQTSNSFGQLPGLGGCGAMATHVKGGRAPMVNASLPPFTWQTYDVDFEVARFNAEGKLQKLPVITLRHNGVLVQDRFELPLGSAGFSPKGGPLYLNYHDEPVVFRNIWLVEK